VFALAFVSLSLASAAGTWLRRRYPAIKDEEKDDLNVIVAATLTLLALIIGFSFSMATNRYDQRKKRRPTPSELNGCVPTFYPQQRRISCASCSAITSTNASRSTPIRTMRSARGSVNAQAN